MNTRDTNDVSEQRLNEPIVNLTVVKYFSVPFSMYCNDKRKKYHNICLVMKQDIALVDEIYLDLGH